MGNDGFDDFESFGDSTFGDMSNDGFGNDMFGDTSGMGAPDFGGSTVDSGMSTQGSGDLDTDAFDDILNSDNNTSDRFSNTDGGKDDLKKRAIILVIIGTVLLILALIVIPKLAGIGKKSADQIMQDNTVVSENNAPIREASNADAILNNNKNATNSSNSTVITNTKSDNFTWSSISDKENVKFNDEYTNMVFTITQIQHKARVTDTNNNLCVKTTLLGSISGLSGTYELDIPYEKGVKLVVGDSFTVLVQLGTFNEKTVVGDIKY